MRKTFLYIAAVAAVVVPLVVIMTLQSVYPFPSKFEGKLIRKIEFVGIKNVDEDDLYKVIESEEGYPLNSMTMKNDIKAVFKKGQFINVRVEVENYEDGVRVRFVCEERPTVSEIVFKGLDEVNETDLKEAMLLKEGDVLRTDLIERSMSLIKNKYRDKGLFNCVVSYQVKKDEKEENSVKVYIIVDEGEQLKVAKISILGAKKIPDYELHAILELSEDGIFTNGDFKVVNIRIG